MIALASWIEPKSKPMPEPIEFEPEGLVCVGLIFLWLAVCVAMAGRRR